MKKIVVIGGGTMGLDIAQVFARNGYDVVVRDIKDEIIQASEARLNKGLDKLVSKGKLDEAKKAEILSHMSFTTELAAAADADLVVEAAIENLDIKKSIFAELDSLCKPETILASNTSSISITAIAAATKRADKFIGMHFFNPATVMKLVEVIRGTHTSDETYKTIAELAAAIGTDAATLEKTIAEYQAAIEKGEDKFNRSHLPESFDGPYYAVRVTGEIRHTQGGMATDLAGHVLRADKSLIKGLYAAGGCTEGFSSRGGAAYMSGNGLIQALVFGKIAGAAAATESPESATIVE